MHRYGSAGLRADSHRGPRWHRYSCQSPSGTMIVVTRLHRCTPVLVATLAAIVDWICLYSCQPALASAIVAIPVQRVSEPGMRSVAYRMSALMLLALPLACTAQNQATRSTENGPAESGPQDLSESFSELVFGFCSALVSQRGEPKLDRISMGVTLRGPFPLSQSGPLSGPLQDRLKAAPESMVYAATTPAVGVGRFQIAYALADGSACVALAQDMPDVVSKISARIESDKQYKLQNQDKERRIYSGAPAGGERSITISMPAPLPTSGIADVQIQRSER